MTAYAVRDDPQLGTRVSPRPVTPVLAELVPRVHGAAWPLWPDQQARMLRDLLELCRLQTARGLTALAWLAAGAVPDDREWLMPARRLAGPRQRRMYDAAAGLPEPVIGLVVANWTWLLNTPYGGRVTAPYLASRAYPDDGYSAAHATVALSQIFDRHPETRPALAAAWAATRTAADWCKAAELCGTVFTYPRGLMPPVPGIRPWIARLLRCS